MFSLAASSVALSEAGSWVQLVRCLVTLSPAPSRIRCTVIGRTFSAQLGERWPSPVRMAAISSSGMPVAGEIEQTVAHFRSSREHGDGVDLHLDVKIGHSAAAPYDPDRGDVVLTAIEHDLFDEAAQQRLALSIRGGRVRPDLREAAGEADNLALKALPIPM